MPDVRWIKITTDMFEDEKIDFIEALPDADTILVMWIKLLTLAGKCNMKGYIFLTENIPYTEEMLAHKFRRPINTVRLALETFQRLGMIEMDNGSRIFVTNWTKHQSTDRLDKLRERDRDRKRINKEQYSMEIPRNIHGTSMEIPPGDSMEFHPLEIEIEKEIEDIYIVGQKEKKPPYQQIVSYLNEKAGTKFHYASKTTKEHIHARWKEGFTLEDFKAVIDKKVSKWGKDAEMAQYLRPQTLFGTKFEGYLNEPEPNLKPPENGPRIDW